jgi:hypothetical protein
VIAGKSNGGQKDEPMPEHHITHEPRSFVEASDVELDPIRNPNKATSATVARGVNKLHKCVETGFANLNAQMEILRGALRIDETGKPVGGSKPIGLLSTWEATWRGAFVIFGGLSCTAFVWRGAVILWPAAVQFVKAINEFIVGH